MKFLQFANSKVNSVEVFDLCIVAISRNVNETIEYLLRGDIFT